MTNPATDELMARLRHAAATAANDDHSEPMTEARRRHVERIEAMCDGADAILALCAESTRHEWFLTNAPAVMAVLRAAWEESQAEIVGTTGAHWRLCDARRAAVAQLGEPPHD